jgi:ketosteroid isomerase-like protein
MVMARARKYPEELLERGTRLVFESGDKVVVPIRNQRQWGRHGGILTELPPFAMVFTFREGKVVCMHAFPDHESALEAVGLAG